MVSFYEELKDPSVSKVQALQAAVFVPNGRRTQFNSSLIASWRFYTEQTKPRTGPSPNRIDKIVKRGRTHLKRRLNASWEEIGKRILPLS